MPPVTLLGLPVPHPGREITFGPFRFQPERQLLMEGDKVVRIGGRALDVLLALVESPGKLVPKSELTTRVWPKHLVGEGNLKSQVALLRKALRDDRNCPRYIVAVPGRGYRFVSAVSASPLPGPPSKPEGTARTAPLPKPTSRAIGRDAVVSAVGKRLEQRRLVTIVGPGGIGKTTVALSVAHAMAPSFGDGVAFIDLAATSGSVAISSVVASAFGLAVNSNNPKSELVAFLQDRRALLVMDSCEHVLEPACLLAEAVLREAPNACVLVTSREQLRAAGESIYHLAPLETPPHGPASAVEALNFPAVELFVERATAAFEGFVLTDENAEIVSNICRKLDGIALAIELAAGRVDAFGLHGLAANLDDRFRLLMQGRRTALPRHRTLGAALDWSYQYLNGFEQISLQRFSIFAGGFSLEAAQAVGNDGSGSKSAVVSVVVADLVAKSLLSVTVKNHAAVYRLLDTTRAYASEKLVESGCFNEIARRHANFYYSILKRAELEADVKPLEEWLETYSGEIDNVRKALDWSFSCNGDDRIAVALVVAALPLWMHLSMMDECRARVEQALKRFSGGENLSPRVELQLYHALGAVLLNIEASGVKLDSALSAAHKIAERLDDTDYRLRVLWCLWCNALNRGAFREAMALADGFRGIAKKSPDPIDRLTAERMRGLVFHFLGDQDSARKQTEFMLRRYVAPVHRAHIIRFQFDQKITAQNTLVLILWLQGHVEQALALNRSNVEEANAFGHNMSLCNALTKSACPVSLMANNLPAAERFIAMLLERSERGGLPMWYAWGKCFEAILTIKRGAAEAGAELLRATLGSLPKNRFSLRYTWVLGEQADGLRLAGRVAEGLRTIDDAIAISERDEELWCIAELLRIKGELLEAEGGIAGERAAAECYSHALYWARRQKVLSWELRVTLSISRLYLRTGRRAEAGALLSDIRSRFIDGFESADMKALTNLKAALS